VFPGLVDVPGFKGRFTLQDWFRFVGSDWDLERDPWQLVDQRCSLASSLFFLFLQLRYMAVHDEVGLESLHR
jgi:hypothetical protein